MTNFDLCALNFEPNFIFYDDSAHLFNVKNFISIFNTTNITNNMYLSIKILVQLLLYLHNQNHAKPSFDKFPDSSYPFAA